MVKFSEWLKTRKATYIFAITSVLFGFVFLSGKITGNVIVSGGYSLNIISLIGSALIFCAIVLGIYSIKKRD